MRNIVIRMGKESPETFLLVVGQHRKDKCRRAASKQAIGVGYRTPAINPTQLIRDALRLPTGTVSISLSTSLRHRNSFLCLAGWSPRYARSSQGIWIVGELIGPMDRGRADGYLVVIAWHACL